MDVNLLRALITLAAFVSFVGIAWWAYSRKSKPRFVEAANLPFADEPSRVATPPHPRPSPPVGGEGSFALRAAAPHAKDSV